jgi:hypothetical protein
MLSLFMKKYTLMIVYDEEKDQIVEMDQKLVDLQPAKVVKEIGVEMNTQFIENLEQLTQETINSIFQAADDSGGLMGDA